VPDIHDVFRMAAQSVKPDPGALERQHRGQRRRSLQRKAEAYAYALLAALLIVGTVFSISVLRNVTEGTARPAAPPGISPGGVADHVPAVEELP
jgi:hypothetical protein